MDHGGDIYRNKVNIDFSVNLNPKGAPVEVIKGAAASLEKADAYPDIRQDEIRWAIADYAELSPDSVLAGSGASELIMALVRAVAPKTALLYEPCFSGYEHALKAQGVGIKRHLLKEQNSFAITDEDTGALTDDIDMVFICDPGNPSGAAIDNEVLTRLLDRALTKGIFVCLDESFLALSDKGEKTEEGSQAELVKRYSNLAILRSMTKVFALPGIRMGYVLSDGGNIERIRAQLPEWNLSVVAKGAMEAGIEVLRKRAFIAGAMAEIKTERQFLSENLSRLSMEVFSSDTCFILFKGPEGLWEKLLTRGILIRDCSNFVGLGPGYYRIAVRGHEDNRALIRAMEEVVNGV
jgi:threonine-phosphate decarboxylase